MEKHTPIRYLTALSLATLVLVACEPVVQVATDTPRPTAAPSTATPVPTDTPTPWPTGTPTPLPTKTPVARPVAVKPDPNLDDFEDGELPSGMDGRAEIGYVPWSDGSAVSITAVVVSEDDPLALPEQASSNTILKLDTDIVSGGWGGFTHAFANDTYDLWVPQDWSSFEGIGLWLSGNGTGGTLFVDVIENRKPGSNSDDAERWTYNIADEFSGWRYFEIPFSEFRRKEIGNGAPNDGLALTEVHGYAVGVYGSVAMGQQTNYVDQVVLYGSVSPEKGVEIAFSAGDYAAVEGQSAVITVVLNQEAAERVTVRYATAAGQAMADRDYTPVGGTLAFEPGATEQSFTIETADDGKFEGDERVMVQLSDPAGAALAFQRTAVLLIQDDDTVDADLLDDFEVFPSFETEGDVALVVEEIPVGSAMALPDQGSYENVLVVDYDTGDGEQAGLLHRFAAGRDWSDRDGLAFWFYGTGSGERFAVELLDNRATTTADVGPDDWVLTWSDEFDGPAGTPPNPAHWTHEIGDGALNGIPGWGNGEFEYYTDSVDNAATDGAGHLAITAREVKADLSGLVCWYGPCEYTSARLISAGKVEFAFGRVEARLKLPAGQGLWPAFWMLGTDIGEVGWPTCGEIDVMENVGRTPVTAYGTVHGPGYSGGSGVRGEYELPAGSLSDDFHIFAVEWQPGEIRWFIDGVNFFTVTPDDIPAGTEWVYDHPFFLIMNVAVGGNWPGDPDETTVFPQTMLVDYVRVYQAADTAERFEATFTDDFTGWRQVRMPFAEFTRSEAQVGSAPGDGLTLTEVWGYGLRLPAGARGALYLDQVRLTRAEHDEP